VFPGEGPRGRDLNRDLPDVEVAARPSHRLPQPGVWSSQALETHTLDAAPTHSAGVGELESSENVLLGLARSGMLEVEGYSPA
jgi:hypothetical protein